MSIEKAIEMIENSELDVEVEEVNDGEFIWCCGHSITSDVELGGDEGYFDSAEEALASLALWLRLKLKEYDNLFYSIQQRND